MGNLLGRLYERMRPPRDVRLLMLGLDNAGKTSKGRRREQGQAAGTLTRGLCEGHSHLVQAKVQPDSDDHPHVRL